MNTSAKSDGRLTIITQGKRITFEGMGKIVTVDCPNEAAKESFMEKINKLLAEAGALRKGTTGTVNEAGHIVTEDWALAKEEPGEEYSALFNKEQNMAHALTGFKDPEKILILQPKKSNQTKISGIS